ncbi:hypothetical protein tloyanaT_28510 [Thalassotalea loyana]|uniref:Methyltransferase domain-containing protein n=1 Tax=Thalassotalea loyana TaxID=280483 RepID=A0ABQ6HET1_9GAMM|nr:class I SAM-dependent methyltransferase [Thalassotalea loyana]GLX86598.1 hypothetical protein tloyanaT_28510 [Thalassotalea loyana]
MEPKSTGQKYDKIASWWHQRHHNSEYGVAQFKRALSYCHNPLAALDVGCGAGGRFINILESQNIAVTGIDVSSEMISLAKKNHPSQVFIEDDICSWDSAEKFDLIYAWDSLFHLPINEHINVITKLANQLNQKGILLYTFGDGDGEHLDTWLDDTFYYSSIGVANNLALLTELDCKILHMEFDQFPQPHVYVIAQKL